MALSPSETMQFASLIVVVLTFGITQYANIKTAGANHERTDAKLDRIDEISSECRDTIKEINRKLDDHSQTLTKHEERIGTLFRRVERIESTLDQKLKENIGGTD